MLFPPGGCSYDDTMRLRSLALIALLIFSASPACRAPGPQPPRRPVIAPTPTPAPARSPIAKPPEARKPLSPAEQAGCKRADATPTLNFVARRQLRKSGVEVCIYSKPDLMLSISPPLGPRYAELLPLARKGNAEAQFKVAVIVNQCSNTPATPELLKSTIATALKTRRYLGGTRVEEPKSFERQMRQEYADCEGVDPADRGRSREWARSAADAGLMDAQESLMFMSRPGSVFYLWKRDTKEHNTLDTTHYKATMTALVAAREAGSVEALLTLAGRYAQEHIDNPPWEREYFDAFKSYAHFAAYDQVQQAVGGKRREPVKGTVAGDMYRRLTPERRVAAEALAKTFLANPRCCVLTQ